MRKRILSLLFISIFSLSLLATPCRVYAEATLNDGKMKSDADAIYKQSGLAVSFKDAQYYDVAVPYAETYESVGGYQTSTEYNVDAQGHSLDPMSDDVKSANIASRVQKEYGYTDMSKYPSFLNNVNDGKSEVKDGKYVYTSKTGVEFYVSAVQGFFFANTGTTDIGLKFGSSAWGTVFDVICADGTVYHMIYGDSNANEHTAGHDTTHCASLANQAYKNLYQSSNGGMLELWGPEAGLPVQEHGGVMYYRFYNKNVKTDDIVAVDEAAKTVEHKIALDGTYSSDSAAANGATSQGHDGRYSEAQLSAWNKLVEPELTDQTSNSTRDSLSSDTMNGLSDWEMNVASTREDAGIIAWVRRGVALMGIFIIIWSMLLYISYWFDLINPFFDFDLMSKLTFGKLCASHELDGSCTWRLELNPKDRSKKTINHRGVIFLTFFGLVFGVLVVSGLLYQGLLWVVNWSQEVIKNLL